MRRWSVRILKWLAIAIIAVMVIVQIVLWTPLPRRILTQQIEKELGLRISAENLSTGWLGNSELTNVSLGLPLSSSDFLKVKKLKIRHSSLIGLALGHVDVESIEIDDPQVEVMQDAQGNWNVQQVLELLGRAGGAKPAQNQSTGNNSGGVPKLPSIKLVNGSIHITDNRNHSVYLKPLNVTGQPNDALVWEYKLTIADSIAMTGKVAPGGNWEHEVTLAAHDLDPLLKDWGVPTTYAANIKSRWEGQLSGGKLTGTLTLEKATASRVPTLGDVQLDGSVDAEVGGGTVMLRPGSLDLKTTTLAASNVGIESGTIISDDSGLRAQGLILRALGGLTHVDATFDPRTSATDVHARWSNLTLAKKTSQDGSLTASLRMPFAGQPVIAVELDDAGTAGSPANRWNARLNLTGQGSSWQTIDWTLTAPQLTCSAGGRAIDLSQMSAHISQHLPIVELTSLSLPANTGGSAPASFSSGGKIDFASGNWNLDATGGLNTTFENAPVPITIALHSHGNSDRYDLQSLIFGFADLTFTVDGCYDKRLPNPVDLHVLLAQTPRIAPDSPVQGEVNGEFKIVGALFKEQGHFRPYLTTTGDLRSSDLVIFNRPIGDIDIKLKGDTKTPNLAGGERGPSVTEIRTIDCYLFQAPWNLTIDYPNADGNIEASLQTRKLSLEELARFAKVKGITGLASAKWNAIIPAFNLNALDVQSQYQVSDLNAFGFTADSVDANVTLKNGMLKLNPLVAKSGSGTITTTASLDLQNPRHLVTETTVERWPYTLSDALTAMVSAHSNLDLDLKAKDLAANGALTASTDLVLGEKTKLAHADLNANILNRVVSIDKLSGNIITGTFNGAAKMDFDKPLQATGQVVWQDIDGVSIGTIFPVMEGLAGKFSGTISMAPAREPKPLEPVRLDVNVASTAAHFRSMQIGGSGLLTMHAVGYLNVDRAVLDHSDIYLASGVAHVWARASFRPHAQLATQANIDFEQFQLDQLARIDTKRTKPMPGILSGHIGLVRSGWHSNQVLAQAHLNLTQTDLGNFGPVAALYNIMHVGSASSGYGSVDLAFEQNILRMTDFSYFCKGFEARGLCSVGPIDYDNLMASRIDGQMIGTVRPLKDVKLPFITNFDQAFNAFQGSLTAINITGALGDAKYDQALASNIGKTLRQLLVGEAQGNGE